MRGEGRASDVGRRVKCASERKRERGKWRRKKGKKERKKVRWKLKDDKEWTEKRNGWKKRERKVIGKKDDNNEECIWVVFKHRKHTVYVS